MDRFKKGAYSKVAVLLSSKKAKNLLTLPSINKLTCLPYNEKSDKQKTI